MNDKTNIVALSNMLSDLSAYAQQASKQLTRLTNQSTRNIAEFINEDMMNIFCCKNLLLQMNSKSDLKFSYSN